MANYSGYGRTNYVVLRDEAAYDAFRALVALLGGTTHEQTDKEGGRSVAAFGHEEDGDFKNTIYVTELVEANYVSVHKDSDLDATRADYLALLAEGHDGESEATELSVDLFHEAYPLLAPGQALIYQTVGHEKLRYVCGSAFAISHEGKTVSLALDDIYEQAEKAFGFASGTATY